MDQPSPNISVLLDNPCPVFQGGDCIRGRIVIILASPLLIAGVELRFRGSAHARWQDEKCESDIKTNIEHDKEEIYFDDRYCLWGNVCSLDGWTSREMLQRGRHTFPFQYKLNDALPCSFESPNGSIRYSASATMICPNAVGCNAETIFAVFKDSFANTFTQAEHKTVLNTQLEDHAEGTPSRGSCCRPGRVSCSLSLSKRHFVPGENIMVNIDIENHALRRTGACILKLKQLVTVGGTQTSSRQLVRVTLCDHMRASRRRHWSNLAVLLPSTCPSHLGPCTLIYVNYCISIDVSIPGQSLYAAVPLTVVTAHDPSANEKHWSYQDESPYIPETISNSSNDQDPSEITNDSTFCPKYKYYNVIENNAQIILLDQSPALPKERRKSTDREPEDNVYVFNTTSDSYFA